MAALSPEDAFVLRWCLAGEKGGDGGSADDHAGLDWEAVVGRARSNRVAPLLFRNLRRRARRGDIPAEAAAGLRRSYVESLHRVTLAVEEIAPLCERFRRNHVPLLVLRGIALGAGVYGDTALRPFTDVDLLVRREDLKAAKNCMEGAGYRASEALLAPRYFEKHHLHLSYKAKPRGVLFELHWALDHKYVPFTIPYGEIFHRAREIEAGSLRLNVPEPEDELLCNIVHAVKHASFIPFERGGEVLPARIMDANCLILFCDLVRQIRQAGSGFDWERISRRSTEWGIEREYHAALRALRALFPGPAAGVPVVAGAVGAGAAERFAYRVLSRRRSGAARLRPAAMFRPIRILDLMRYAFPGAAYLKKRYCGTSSWAVPLFALLHPVVALCELAMNGIEWAWYSGGRRRRGKPGGEQSSL